MKLLYLWAVTLLLCSIAWAVDPYITKSKGMLPICDQGQIELPNLPPVMDQGNYGLCYAHSSLLLLEHLRCGKSPNPTSCYSDRGSVLHLARFTNVYEEKIPIGGHPGSVLSNFKYQGKKLSRESCAPYEKWHELDQNHKEERSKLILPPIGRAEYDYFYYLHLSLRKDPSTLAKECWATEILSMGLNHNIDDLMAVLNKAQDLSWQELRYSILVPKSCQQNFLEYPDFQIISYPRNREAKTFKGFRDQVYRSLSKGYPLEASFCASSDARGKCSYHSATIVGQRHVCNKQDCRLQFRIQNSYGKSWQQHNDNGWVDAENLSELMNEHTLGLTTILPKGEGLDKKAVSPFYVGSPINQNARLVYHGNEKCWKVDATAINSRPDRDTRPSAPSIYSNPTPKPNPNGKVIYICKKDGSTIFTDQPQSGMDCRMR